MRKNQSTYCLPLFLVRILLLYAINYVLWISEICRLDIRQRDETIWDGESVDRSLLRKSALANFATLVYPLGGDSVNTLHQSRRTRNLSCGS